MIKDQRPWTAIATPTTPLINPPPFYFGFDDALRSVVDR